jgi:hypothetical protein
MQYMATITLRLPDALDDALQRQGNAAGVSKIDLAGDALRRLLTLPKFHAGARHGAGVGHTPRTPSPSQERQNIMTGMGRFHERA